MKTKTSVAFALILTMGLSCLAEEPLVISPTQINVNVLGKVNKQGRFMLASGSTVLDALASAGGASDLADLARVKLIHRTTGEKPAVSEINVKKILDGTAPDVALRDGDTADVLEMTFKVSY
jgi:protein involved in polysaccharide export with SLBB domain